MIPKPLENPEIDSSKAEKVPRQKYLATYLLPYMQGISHLNPKQKAKFRKRTEELAENGDATAVNSMRRADVAEKTDSKNPLKKHILLSALYLERDQKLPNTISFRVNFENNSFAEKVVGAGHLLPASVREISVQYPDGRVVERAIRATDPENGRTGYYEADTLFQKNFYQYVPVFTDTKITILATASPESGAVRRATYGEHMEIYHPPKRPDIAGASEEKFQPGQASLEKPGSITIENIPFPTVDRGYWTRTVGSNQASTERFITRGDPLTGKPISFMGSPVPGGVNILMLPYLKEAEARIRAAGISDPIHTATCTCWRKERGGSNQSYHSWGVAIDINPQDNPMGTKWSLLNPEKRISVEFANIMKDIGFEWGGDWGRPDAMHFRLLVDPLKSAALLKSPESRRYLEYAYEIYQKYHPDTHATRAVEEKAASAETLAQKKPKSYREAIARILNENPEFLSRVGEIAAKVGCSTEAFLAIMLKESGLNPAAKNPISDASGLIQFMPSTLKDAKYGGITTGELRKLSPIEQLKYVEMYFQPHFGRLHSYTDLYLAVFYPAALGKPDDFIMGSERGDEQAKKVAKQNPGIAPPGEYITVRHFRDYAKRGLPPELGIV